MYYSIQLYYLFMEYTCTDTTIKLAIMEGLYVQLFNDAHTVPTITGKKRENEREQERKREKKRERQSEQNM